MTINIDSVTPPIRGRGRPKRLSDEHIQTLLAKVRAGEFASDNETSKKSAASQRGRKAKADLIAAGYNGDLVVKTWEVAPSDTDDQWMWAVGPK